MEKKNKIIDSYKRKYGGIKDLGDDTWWCEIGVVLYGFDGTFEITCGDWELVSYNKDVQLEGFDGTLEEWKQENNIE